MFQQVKVFAEKHDLWDPHEWKEKIESQKLFSDLHTYYGMYTPTHRCTQYIFELRYKIRTYQESSGV